MVEPILTYYDFGSDVTAFSTTRHGGYSKGQYGAFNINRYCGDDVADANRNLELLCRKLSVKPKDIVMPHQKHTTTVKVVDENFFELTGDEQLAYLEGVDALMTRVRRICIGVSTADCVPVLLYDAFHQVVAAVHSGWRGTKDKIAAITVKAMKEKFGTRPSDLVCAIGPCIDKESFEVGNEVYEAFDEAGFPMEKISEIIGGKWHIDLPLSVMLTLTGQGVKSENIYNAGISSFKNVRDYFSARRLTINSGRTFTGIILR